MDQEESTDSKNEWIVWESRGTRKRRDWALNNDFKLEKHQVIRKTCYHVPPFKYLKLKKEMGRKRKRWNLRTCWFRDCRLPSLSNKQKTRKRKKNGFFRCNMIVVNIDCRSRQVQVRQNKLDNFLPMNWVASYKLNKDEGIGLVYGMGRYDFLIVLPLPNWVLWAQYLEGYTIPSFVQYDERTCARWHLMTFLA